MRAPTALPPAVRLPGCVLLGVMVRQALPAYGRKRFNLLPSEGRGLAVDAFTRMVRRHGLKRGDWAEVLDRLSLGEPHDLVWVAPDSPASTAAAESNVDLIVLTGCRHPKSLWFKTFSRLAINEYVDPETRRKALEHRYAEKDRPRNQRRVIPNKKTRRELVPLPEPERPAPNQVDFAQLFDSVLARSSDEIQQIINRKALGETVRAIGKLMHLPRSTVQTRIDTFSMDCALAEQALCNADGLDLSSGSRRRLERQLKKSGGKKEVLSA